MLINPKYAVPILTLANALTEHQIPFTLNVCWEGLQIRFPWNNGDIICHGASYGHDSGDVESMGCPWDGEDVTRLNPDEALEGIIAWYTEVGG